MTARGSMRSARARSGGCLFGQEAACLWQTQNRAGPCARSRPHHIHTHTHLASRTEALLTASRGPAILFRVG
eukprot:1926750-Rhodomonas_salina.2